MQSCSKPSRNCVPTTGSVNEALARGLRTRIIRTIETAEDSSKQVFRAAARKCSAPATRKGARRLHKEQTRIYAPLLVAPAPELVGDRYAVWLCWHVFNGDVAAGFGHGELGVVAHMADLMGGVVRTFPLPVRLRDHVIDRSFQRLGTTVSDVVFDELRHAILSAAVLGLALTAVSTFPEIERPEEPTPFLLPTPQGAVLGDLLPQWPFITINTYVGGRRPITAAKERLRAAMCAALGAFSLDDAALLVRNYFVGMYCPQANGGRFSNLRDASLRDAFQVMSSIAQVMHRHRNLLLTKSVRDDEMQRSELMWRWATLQHRTQCSQDVSVAAGGQSTGTAIHVGACEQHV